MFCFAGARLSGGRPSAHFWGASGCSWGSLAGPLGSLGVLWVSLGRPLVLQGGLLVSLWRPLGCVGCLLGPLGAPKWSFGWLVGGCLAALVPSGAFFGGPRGFSRILLAFPRAGQKPSSKKEQSKRKRDTPTRTQHPLQNRASRSMTHRFTGLRPDRRGMIMCVCVWVNVCVSMSGRWTIIQRSMKNR